MHHNERHSSFPKVPTQSVQRPFPLERRGTRPYPSRVSKARYEYIDPLPIQLSHNDTVLLPMKEKRHQNMKESEVINPHSRQKEN